MVPARQLTSQAQTLRAMKLSLHFPQLFQVEPTDVGCRGFWLNMITTKRPRNVDWPRAAAILYGDWGTSKAYVIGLAFAVAGYASFWLIAAIRRKERRGPGISACSEGNNSVDSADWEDS